jgi:ABC-2 type transport system permease protein
MSANVLVNPFAVDVTGITPEQFGPTDFFAPAVIVLLLQHLSITLSSLSIVRERRSGIMEVFRVSPITAFEILLGKFLTYLVFEIILAAILSALIVWGLGVPMLGNWWHYALAVIIVLFTSLGLGFLISLISKTDTQAVQYSMLLLLASIFFSGFLLDLRLMWQPVTVLAWSLPATYGITMLQDIMLRGAPIPLLIFAGIAAIGIGLFVIDWLILRRIIEVQYSST